MDSALPGRLHQARGYRRSESEHSRYDRSDCVLQGGSVCWDILLELYGLHTSPPRVPWHRRAELLPQHKQSHQTAYEEVSGPRLLQRVAGGLDRRRGRANLAMMHARIHAYNMLYYMTLYHIFDIARVIIQVCCQLFISNTQPHLMYIIVYYVHLPSKNLILK